MASLKSRKALFAALQSIPGAILPKTYKGLPNEVYGRKAVCYPRFESLEARRNAERILTEQGFRVEPGYSTTGNVASVPVSYFKGWHWDE